MALVLPTFRWYKILQGLGLDRMPFLDRLEVDTSLEHIHASAIDIKYEKPRSLLHCCLEHLNKSRNDLGPGGLDYLKAGVRGEHGPWARKARVPRIPAPFSKDIGCQPRYIASQRSIIGQGYISSSRGKTLSPHTYTAS